MRAILHEATKDHEEHEGFFVLKVFVIFVILRAFVISRYGRDHPWASRSARFLSAQASASSPVSNVRVTTASPSYAMSISMP